MTIAPHLGRKTRCAWARRSCGCVLLYGCTIVAILYSTLTTASPVDFDTQVIPVLTRSGCNAGACHGAAAGRGGFKLSLWGGDPAADYDAIVRNLSGRRINTASPASSLVVRKPTLAIDHEGGQVLSQEGTNLLVTWIRQGAKRLRSRSLVSLHVEVDSTAARQQSIAPLKVLAHFDDHQPAQDVTGWVAIVANDPSAVTVLPDNRGLSINRGGQQVINLRFLNRVLPITLTVPLGEKQIDHAQQIRHNFIDNFVFQSLSQLHLPVDTPAGDATFVRRISLDLTGRLPDPDLVKHFVEDTAHDKRDRLIDVLLDSDAFVEYWSFRFAKWLRIVPQPNDLQAAERYTAWVREQVRDGIGLDKLARQLLLATGDTRVVGPANFSRNARDARMQAEWISEMFMGARLQCANCHNHPLDRWTQDDYHGLAAIFAKIERGSVVTIGRRGAVTNLRTGEPALARIPGARFVHDVEDPRVAFADWLLARDNLTFAKAWVNRLWYQMFGRGLVDPVDDLRETNPATHPELLEHLAKYFVDGGFDLRQTLRVIAQSAAYQRRSVDKPHAIESQFYVHQSWRPLEAEVLADAIADASGIWDRYGDQADGTRAISLVDPATASVSLDALGRCSRRSSCEAELVSTTLPRQLHQLNGGLVNDKVVHADGILHQLIDRRLDNPAIVCELYLRTLARPPTERELEYWLGSLNASAASERVAILEDLFWGLLNCREFTHNH